MSNKKIIIIKFNIKPPLNCRAKVMTKCLPPSSVSRELLFSISSIKVYHPRPKTLLFILALIRLAKFSFIVCLHLYCHNMFMLYADADKTYFPHQRLSLPWQKLTGTIHITTKFYILVEFLMFVTLFTYFFLLFISTGKMNNCSFIWYSKDERVPPETWMHWWQTSTANNTSEFSSNSTFRHTHTWQREREREKNKRVAWANIPNLNQVKFIRQTHARSFEQWKSSQRNICSWFQIFSSSRLNPLFMLHTLNSSNDFSLLATQLWIVLCGAQF